MRILVIEDENEVASLVQRALQEEWHAVDLAPDGVAGERMAFTEAYDLIILDLMLPCKDDLAVLKTLRQQKITTPVLLLTARAEVRDRVDGLDAGYVRRLRQKLEHDNHPRLIHTVRNGGYVIREPERCD